MKLSRVFLCLLGAVFILPCLCFGFNKDKEASRNREKARYFYLKAAQKEAEEKLDESLELYRKAYETDTTYLDAMFIYGLRRLFHDTMPENIGWKKSLALMRPYLDKYPRDVESAQTYAIFAAICDSVEEGVRVYDNLVKLYPGKSGLYYTMSMMLMQTGRTEDAVQAMREFERLEGVTRETTFRKIGYYITDNDTAHALQEARVYAESNPGQPEALEARAMIYNMLDRKDSAIYFLEQALLEFPDNNDIKIDLAMLHFESGDTLKFHTLTQEAFMNEAMEYEDHMLALEDYMKRLPVNGDDYSRSDSIFQYALSLYPNDPDMMDRYSNYELMKGDKKGAYEYAKKALELVPEDDWMLYKVVSMSIMAEVPEEGVRIYEAASDSADRGMMAQEAYILAASASKDYAKALSTTDSMMHKIIPELSTTVKLDSVMLDSLGKKYSVYDFRSAVNSFELAAEVYQKMGDSDGVLRNYENALLLDDNNASILNNFAYYLVDKIKVKPDSPEFKRAKEMSRKSVEISQSLPQGIYYDTYAWILFKEGNYKEALDYIELAIDTKDGEQAEIKSHYGDILFMNGRPEEALEQWEKALEKEPDNELLKKKVQHKTFFYDND